MFSLPFPKGVFGGFYRTGRERDMNCGPIVGLANAPQSS